MHLVDREKVEKLKEDMLTPKPLPMGLEEFHVWADRIIAQAMIKYEDSQKDVFIDSQKYALANMLMHLSPTSDHETDVYFVKSLRKYAINQVADYYRQDVYKKRKAISDAQEAKKAREAHKFDEDSGYEEDDVGMGDQI